MTQSVAQKTSIPEKTWRRHADSPKWWIAFSCGAVILHLLAFWLLSLYELNSSRQGRSPSAVPIEFIEISPQKSSPTRSKPKQTSPKPSNIKPKQATKPIVPQNSQLNALPNASIPPVSTNNRGAIAFDIDREIERQLQQQQLAQKQDLEAKQLQREAEQQRQLEAEQRQLAEQLRQRVAQQKQLEAQLRQQEVEQQRRLAEQLRQREAQQRQLESDQRQREAQQRQLEQRLRQREVQQRQLAEAQIQREAEERQRQLAEAQIQREAEERQRLLAEAQIQQEADERQRQLAEAQIQQEAEERQRQLAEKLRQRETEQKPLPSVTPPGQPGGRVVVGEGTSLEELAQPNDGEQQAGTAIARWQVEADEHQQKQDTITPTGGNLAKPIGTTREKKLSLPSLNAATNSQPIQFQASLIIDSFGNLNDVWINPAIKEPQRSQYRKYVMEIFQGVKFKPAQNSNGSKPPLSNLVVRINIRRSY